MKHELSFYLLGGDLRQVHLARLLAQDGHRVRTFGLNHAILPTSLLSVETNLTELPLADAVILPMPTATPDGLLHTPLSPAALSLAAILDHLSPHQFLCGGRVDTNTLSLAQQRGLSLSDYFQREELIIANCVPTAEGAIQLALEHLPTTIQDSRILVIGFGRLGKITAQRFAALGGKVTVAARKYEHLAWACASGFGTEQVTQLNGWLCSYDLIVNTVPSLVLGEEELSDLRRDCLIIDLASDPGGVDREAAQQLGLQVIWALSLPGKVAPVTAGAIIKTTIYHMLQEHGF